MNYIKIAKAMQHFIGRSKVMDIMDRVTRHPCNWKDGKKRKVSSVYEF